MASVALILMRCFCIIGVAALSLVLASSVAGSPAGAVGNSSLFVLHVAQQRMRHRWYAYCSCMAALRLRQQNVSLGIAVARRACGLLHDHSWQLCARSVAVDMCTRRCARLLDLTALSGASNVNYVNLL